MKNKEKLKDLLNKLNFLIKIDENSINISKIEQLLGELVPIKIHCEVDYTNKKLL